MRLMTSGPCGITSTDAGYEPCSRRNWRWPMTGSTRVMCSRASCPIDQLLFSTSRITGPDLLQFR